MGIKLRQLDRGTLLGAATAVVGIVAGLWLDGGNVSQILQPTAALIVLGGTLGAVLIQFPWDTVKEAATQLRHVLFDTSPSWSALIDEIVTCCALVRRHGLLHLDSHLDRIAQPFLRKSLTLAVDGTSINELRALMEVDLDLYDEREQAVIAVLEAAAGFAPTLGIIGAVLGLIQVMQRMSNVSEIGRGIAVAFVSTLYGLGVANLVLLPMAGKLRTRLRTRQLMREMTMEAVVSILDGASARGLRDRLMCYPMALTAPAASKRQPKPELTNR